MINKICNIQGLSMMHFTWRLKHEVNFYKICALCTEWQLEAKPSFCLAGPARSGHKAQPIPLWLLCAFKDKNQLKWQRLGGYCGDSSWNTGISRQHLENRVPEMVLTVKEALDPVYKLCRWQLLSRKYETVTKVSLSPEILVGTWSIELKLADPESQQIGMQQVLCCLLFHETVWIRGDPNCQIK
jgi:hypothetical protein